MVTPLRRAVFLDRDGVINRSIVVDGKPYPPRRLEEFEILPGVADALRDLRQSGYLLIVVTNQPDVADGLMTAEVLESIHRRMLAELPLDAVKVCLCGKNAGCECYKPKPGMLLEAAHEWHVDIAASYMVGDRWRDVGAGRAAGCTTYFIDLGYAEPLQGQPDFIVADLPAAVAHILASMPDGRDVRS